MRTSFTLEKALYFVAFLLALSLRFVHLGAVPLSDFEAEWALQAYQLAQGREVFIGPQPAYVMLTTFLFSILGSSDALARFWPALVGSVIVWVPFIFRHHLRRKAGLLLAFGLALDPGLVALSRLAGGPMLALGFILLAAAAWVAGLPLLAGALIALALLSGPAALAGLVGLLLTWGLARVFIRDKDSALKLSLRLPAEKLRLSLFSAAGTLILVGTLFLRFPQGLSALADAVPAYFSGWTSPSGVPFVYLLIALAAYQPLAVVFGYVGLLRAWVQEQSLGKALSLWFAVALALALAYPGREVYDLAWALVPLWALTALEISRHFHWKPENIRAIAGYALLVILLLTFFYLNVEALSVTASGTRDYDARLGIAAGALILVVLATVLVGYGWSTEVAGKGLAGGASLFLTGLVLSASWGVTRPGPRLANEVWLPTPVAGHVYLFRETLGDLSEWHTGHRAGAQIIYQVDWPSLQWALRDLPEAEFAGLLPPDASPPLIASNETASEPSLSAGYRGQSFAWRVYPSWKGGLPADLLRWWLFRDAPTFSEKLILWGRTDVFPQDVLAGSQQEEGQELESLPQE